MAENKEGQMIGREFFSAAMPQGSGEVKYDEAQSDTILQVLQTGVTPEHLLAAQKLMIRLGYLDKCMDDGMKGPKTMGAARRYQSNTSEDQMIRSMKSIFEGLFD